MHLTKDVGMIPFILHKNHGYNSYIICYKGGDFPHLETEVPGLKLILVDHIDHFKMFRKHSITLNTILDAFLIFFRYRKKIQVLQIYHYCLLSFIIATIYKLINRKGCLFLKLDYNPNIVKLYERRRENMGRKIRDYFFRVLFAFIFDIITVETLISYKFLRSKHPRLKGLSDRIYYIPNGVDVNKLSSLKFDGDEKENIILHVGRIGNYQKGTDIVLKTFARVAMDFTQWRLFLVGPIDDEFGNYLKEFLESNESIRSRISCIGFIEDKRQFWGYYKKSKVLAFPSRFEAFSTAAIEAGYFRDVILGSDLDSIRELTNDGKLVYMCPVDDIECFEKKLRYILSHEDEVRQKSEALRSYVIDNYDWNKIGNNLHQIITSKLHKNAT